MKEKKEDSFEENFQKLQTFSKELQENSVTIDALIPRMKDALSAVKVCKGVLEKTNSQLVELSAEFKSLES